MSIILIFLSKIYIFSLVLYLIAPGLDDLIDMIEYHRDYHILNFTVYPNPEETKYHRRPSFMSRCCMIVGLLLFYIMLLVKCILCVLTVVIGVLSIWTYLF
jgi:hypothetical protein